MKKEFSKSWKSSKQPRKQVKYRANAPIHLKRKFLGSNLSKELRKKYEKRSLPLRKGDVVKIMRGKFKGKKGKIINVKIQSQKIWVEGIQVKKQDGSKVNVSLKPSNLQIVELNLEDKKRNKFLKKGLGSEKAKEKPTTYEKSSKKDEENKDSKKQQTKEKVTGGKE